MNEFRFSGNKGKGNFATVFYVCSWEEILSGNFCFRLEIFAFGFQCKKLSGTKVFTTIHAKFSFLAQLDLRYFQEVVYTVMNIHAGIQPTKYGR